MKLCLRCNQYFEDGIELCPIDTSQLVAVGDHPLIGALINDRYVVDSVIGKGSTGIVYKATRLLMGSEVAVKVLHSYLGAEAGALDRFLREARAASRLRHPHIINIWEFGATDDGQPYFVMDYLQGMTLADLIKQKGVLHPMKMLPIIKQVCEALAEAHKQNIIHRDIKPENVVLQETDYANGQDFVKVLDFGIADQPASGGQKRSKMAAGSPAYMSPEQCQGFELDFRTDIYSLGIVIFEMLTGQRPFTADDVMNLFYQHVSKAPPSMGSLRPDLKFSAQLEQVVLKALAKKPQQRQSSIKEFQKDLEEACRMHDPKRKNDTFSFDLYSLPTDDRLTTTEGPAKRKANFLPGPEEILFEEAGGNDRLVPGASMNAPSPGNETADHNPLPAKSASAQPDYQEAVNRLLKSAKRASETPAVQGQQTPAAAEPQQGANDVSNWAREVLTRSGDKKPVESNNANAPPKETFKSTTRSSGSHPAAPSNSEPPKPAASKANPETDSRTRAPEAPEVSSWAQRVLSRSAENKSSTPEHNLTESDMPQTLDPTSSSTEHVPPPAVQDKTPEPAANVPLKPADFLRSKSKEAAQMKASSESQTNRAVPASESVSPVVPAVPEPAPVAEVPKPVPPMQFDPAPTAPPPIPDRFQSKPAAEVNLPQPEPESIAEPVKPAYKPPATSIESMLSELDAISAATAAAAQQPAPVQTPAPAPPPLPAEPPAAKIKKTGGFALAAEKLMGAIKPDKDKHAPEPPVAKTKELPAKEHAAKEPVAKVPAAAPPKSNNNNNPPAAAPVNVSPANAADAEEEYQRHFDEPVNKGTEQINSFANAVGALLDAAILPKKASDTGRFTRSTESPFIKSSESPVYPQAKPIEPTAAKASAAVPPTEPVTPPPANKPMFDPKRFDEPVNKGGLGTTRFDAEVNRALKPVSEHALPALDAETLQPRAQTPPAAGAPPAEPRRVSLEERMAAAANKAADQGKNPTTSASNLDARLAAADAAAAAKAEAEASSGGLESRLAAAAEQGERDETARKTEENANVAQAIRAAHEAKAIADARSAEEARISAEARATRAAAIEARAMAAETEAARVVEQAKLATEAEETRAADETRAVAEARAAEEALALAEEKAQAEAEAVRAEEETRVAAEAKAAREEEESKQAADAAQVAAEAEKAETEKRAAQAARAAAIRPEFAPDPRGMLDQEETAKLLLQPSSEEIDVTPPPAEQSKEVDLSPLAKPEVDLPSMGRSSGRGESRQDKAIKSLEATTADSQPASEVGKGSLDPKRFDQPVNEGKEKLNSLAQAIDGAMDAVMAKPSPPVMDSPTIGQTETGMIDSARLKAKVASLKAGLANPASMLQQPPKAPPPPPPPPTPPPPPVLVQPEATSSSPPSADDKMSDAVTRLIEAAQKVPDAVTASSSQAKPEALNRKIEAVKKKIEALKAGQQGVTQESTMPQTPLPAPEQAPAPAAVPTPPAPPRSVPQGALADPGSVSDAVNRLLEAAQSGVYPTVGRGGGPKNSQNMRVSETGLSNVGRSGENTSATTPAANSASNFDPASNRAAAELAAMKAARGAEVTDYYAGFKQVEKLDKASLAEKRKQDRARLRTVKKGGLPLWAWGLLAVAAGGVLYFTLMPHPTATVPKTVDEMIKNEDFEGARGTLEKKLKKTSKLTAAEQSKLYQAYVGLGRQQGEEGDYETAVATLRLVPAKAKSFYKQAKDLIKQYKGKPNKVKKVDSTTTTE